MVKAEFGTAKYLSNQMKARGLQKLRFYCQVCEKQCRDENGFKSHIRSPFHMKNISKVSEKDIEEYTRQFEDDFLRLLRLSHGEKEVSVNKFYNEFIQDKHHIHMNATKFTSLTRFIQHLSKNGKVRVSGLEGLLEEEVDPSQLGISFIDRSHQNVLRKAKMEELSKNDKSEQEVKSKLLQRQIESYQRQNASGAEDNGHGITAADLSVGQEIRIGHGITAADLSVGQEIRIDLKPTRIGTGASKKGKKKVGRVNKNVFK